MSEVGRARMTASIIQKRGEIRKTFRAVGFAIASAGRGGSQTNESFRLIQQAFRVGLSDGTASNKPIFTMASFSSWCYRLKELVIHIHAAFLKATSGFPRLSRPGQIREKRSCIH